MPKEIKAKMQELRREIEIPSDVEVSIENNEIIARKEGKENKRKFDKVEISKKDSKIIVSMKKATRKEKKQINTAIAHIKNIFLGLKEKFVYKLQICSVHFPMNVSIDKVKNDMVIKNFLGEKKERRSRIMPNTNVKIDGDIITVDSPDVEAAGQTAANMEIITKIRNRDRRIFQDGIWMTEKAGVKLE